MIGQRVTVDRDDLERLLDLAEQPKQGLPRGWAAFGPDGEGPIVGEGRDVTPDVDDERLLERVRRDAGIR